MTDTTEPKKEEKNELLNGTEAQADKNTDKSAAPPDVPKPIDDKDAPHGRGHDGKPLAPYGYLKSGKPRRTPPKPKDRVNREPPLAGRAGSRVEPGKAKNPYAMLEALLKDERAVVERIRKEHPNSPIGDVVDPRDSVKAKMLDEPMFDRDVIAEALKNGVTMLAVLTNCEYRPRDEACKKAGESLAHASKYLGVEVNPRAVAISQAASAVAALCLPIAIEIIARKFEGDKDKAA